MDKSRQFITRLLQNPLKVLTAANMAFWLLPPLMILLVIGTVTQRWIGLYNAIDIYFTSFFFWQSIGPIAIPLPGGFTLLGLLSLNLLLKFTFKSEWGWKKSGIILSHLGALILLIGGLITALAARESYILIPEGAETPYIYHYTKRNLSVYENEREILRLPYKDINNWQKETQNLPFSMKIISNCNNCEIQKREETGNYDTNKTYQNMAQFMALLDKEEELEPEANLTGLTFEITGTDNKNGDGTHIAFDGMPKPIEFAANGKTYTLIFGKEQKTLPFSIKLIDFVKTDYPGTNTAKSYHSDVIVKDAGLEWPLRIEMNKPLRYKGYTFFQSSFEQTPNLEMTILAVVENKGWIVPYLGTGILGLGLLLHILITMKIGIPTRTENAKGKKAKS